MLQHLIIQFSFYYLSSCILRESKCGRHSLALKVVAVAYERWSLTTGSKYSDSTWNLFRILESWSLRRGCRNQRFHRSWIRPRGKGYNLTPLQWLKWTRSQQDYIFRDFCPKQGIDFIFCCLKQGIDVIISFFKQVTFSWTTNSLLVCTTN